MFLIIYLYITIAELTQQYEIKPIEKDGTLTTQLLEIQYSLYKQVMEINKSFVLPGIPEYFDGKGRGMYHYLTGSASWLILVVVEEMFGVNSLFGDYIFAPKLLKSQFDKEGKARITTLLNNKKVNITYVNKKHLEFDKYQIKEVYLNGEKCDAPVAKTYKLNKELISNLENIEIVLG